jgi:hypothetical protein
MFSYENFMPECKTFTSLNECIIFKTEFELAMLKTKSNNYNTATVFAPPPHTRYFGHQKFKTS